MHGTSINPYAREPSRNIPRGWTFIRLVSPSSYSSFAQSFFFELIRTAVFVSLSARHQAPNKTSLGYLETQHQHATKPTMEDLNERSSYLFPSSVHPTIPLCLN